MEAAWLLPGSSRTNPDSIANTRNVEERSADCSSASCPLVMGVEQRPEASNAKWPLLAKWPELLEYPGFSGVGEIRTHGTLTGSTVFKTELPQIVYVHSGLLVAFQ